MVGPEVQTCGRYEVGVRVINPRRNPRLHLNRALVWRVKTSIELFVLNFRTGFICIRNSLTLQSHSARICI